LGVIAAAIGLFIATNIDALLVLTALFFVSHQTGCPRMAQVITGWVLGSLLLIAASSLAAGGLTIVPDQWVGLLGLIPLILGLRGLHRARHHDPGQPALAATTTAEIVMIAVANGGDNLSAYTPVLRLLGPAQALLTVAVFAVMLGLWCGIARLISTRKPVVVALDRAGPWLVPLVYVALGVVIVVGSGLLARTVASARTWSALRPAGLTVTPVMPGYGHSDTPPASPAWPCLDIPRPLERITLGPAAGAGTRSPAWSSGPSTACWPTSP